MAVADLDEMILRVRTVESRKYAIEAVRAYRAGAFRAAIVAIWIAIVFDLTGKIRELAAQRDPAAIKYVADLNKAIASRSQIALMKIEGEVLIQSTQPFQLISESQNRDLEFLRQDRHLSAHPAYVSEEQLFDPDGERVRFHIANAINYVLSQAPTQGKAALDHIVSDIASAAFPTDSTAVEEYIYGRYLGRARDALIRSVVVVLVQHILSAAGTLLAGRQAHMLAVLCAIARRNGAIYEDATKNALAKFFGPTTEQLAGACELLVSDPAMWLRLDEPQRIMLRGFIQSYAAAGAVPATDVTAIGCVVAVQPLRDDVLAVFAAVSREQQAAMIEAAFDRTPYVAGAIKAYSAAGDFRSAERDAAALILPLIRTLSDENVDEILDAVKKNRQIWQAGRTEDALIQLQRAHPGAAWDSFVEWANSSAIGVSYATLKSAITAFKEGTL